MQPEEPETPRLAAPMPHHDDGERDRVSAATEESLLHVAAGPVEDVAVVADGQEEDGWGLSPEGEEEQGALTAMDEFADRKEVDAQDEVLPAIPAVLEHAHVPDEGDFADFSAPEVSDTTHSHGWEPLEDPGQQISSPPLSRPQHVDQDHDDVPALAVSVNEEPFAREQVALSTSDSSADQPRKASMSSPEVIDHADAWDIDGEGAEALEAAPEAEEPHDGVHDSTVQHELERPTQRGKSTVQHEAMRPLVDDAVVVPGILLPAQDAHPQERTFTPPPTFLPDNDAAPLDSQSDIAAADERDGAEVLEEPNFEAQEGPELIEDESTVQHQAQRSITLVDAEPHDTVAAEAVQPQEHTFSPALDTLPHDEDDDRGWNLDETADDGAAVLQHDPPIDVEQPAPPVPGESAVQHVAERHVVPAVGDSAEVLPAELLQPERHTFSPPPTSVPHEAQPTVTPDELADGDAGPDDPWDLEPVEPRLAPASNSAPAAEVLDGEADDALAEARPESRATNSADKWAVFADHARPRTTFDTAEGRADVGRAAATSHQATAPAPPPVEPTSVVQHVEERPIVPESTESDVAAAVSQPQQHTSTISPDAVPSSSADVAEADEPAQTSTSASVSGEDWSWDDLQESSPQLVAPGDRSSAPVEKPREVVASTGPTEAPKAADDGSAARDPPAHVSSKSIDEWKWEEDDTTNLAAAPDSQAAPPPSTGAASETVNPPKEPTTPPVRREKMMVSKRSREIVKIAQEVLLEACHVADPSYVTPSAMFV